jgi:hypothetical protein
MSETVLLYVITENRTNHEIALYMYITSFVNKVCFTVVPYENEVEFEWLEKNEICDLYCSQTCR